VTVPDLTGLTLVEADARAVTAGLRIGVVARADGPLPAGTVLSSDPVAGGSLAAGEGVALIVASGVNAVPDVLGLDPSVARGLLEAAGFAVIERESTAGPVGTVLGTEPGPGGRLGVASVVVLLVAPPAPPEPPAPPAPTASAGPAAA